MNILSILSFTLIFTILTLPKIVSLFFSYILHIPTVLSLLKQYKKYNLPISTLIGSPPFLRTNIIFVRQNNQCVFFLYTQRKGEYFVECACFFYRNKKDRFWERRNFGPLINGKIELFFPQDIFHDSPRETLEGKSYGVSYDPIKQKLTLTPVTYNMLEKLSRS